jgi:hypothetical protein
VYFEVENQPVGDHLRNEMWRLKTALKEPMGECPICTDELDCKKCTLLLLCGHCVCAGCWVKMSDQRCPICRK